jgi:hypothetical protein
LDATVTVALKQMYPTVETDDEDEEVDEAPDFGSGWSSLGIGRLLVLALVLALFISTGLCMLEAQFQKQEQAARLDPRNVASEHTGPDRPASQAQPPPAGSREPSSTASPAEQTSVPSAPAEPESRLASVIKPGSRIRAAEAPAKLPPVAVKMAPPLKETEKPPAKKAIPPLEIKHPQEAAPLSPAFAVATAICGLEARANEGQPKTEAANRALILKGADQAFKRRFTEGFIQQSCLVRDLHQKAKQLEEKIKEAEEKRDKSREQQSLMLTLSAERQRIEAEKIAAEQTLNERLKKQKLAHDFELLQEKSASGDTIDEPSAQLPANAIPLANAKKLVALQCSNLLSRLQLGESDQSDHNALRRCKLR